MNEISLARASAHSFNNEIAATLDGEVQISCVGKHRLGWNYIGELMGFITKKCLIANAI